MQVLWSIQPCHPELDWLWGVYRICKAISLVILNLFQGLYWRSSLYVGVFTDIQYNIITLLVKTPTVS